MGRGMDAGRKLLEDSCDPFDQGRFRHRYGSHGFPSVARGRDLASSERVLRLAPRPSMRTRGPDTRTKRPPRSWACRLRSGEPSSLEMSTRELAVAAGTEGRVGIVADPTCDVLGLPPRTLRSEPRVPEVLREGETLLHPQRGHEPVDGRGGDASGRADLPPVQRRSPET